MSTNITLSTKNVRSAISKQRKQKKNTQPRVLKNPKPIKRKQAKRSDKTPTRKARYGSCYSRVLNDPFNNPPCLLGFGTMIPTEIVTGRIRTNLTTNADGSIAMYISPAIGANASSTLSAFQYNNAGAGVATWTGVKWDNIAAFNGLMLSARVIACAVKVFPLVAATATPPVVYSGALSGLAPANLQAVTPNTLLGYTQLEKFIGSGEYIARSRPNDIDAYEFKDTIYTNSASAYNDNSFPVVVITGAPASSTVSVECIAHFEYIPSLTSTVQPSPVGNDTPSARNETLSGAFESMESLWSYVSPYLDSPGAKVIQDKATKILSAKAMQELNRAYGIYPTSD